MPADLKPYRIRSLEQLEVVALPVRTEFVESVSFLGPCSVGDLSRILGRKRPAVHFHVGKLLEVGLLLEAGERGEGRKREVLYRTPGSPMFVVYDRKDRRNVELTVRYTRNMLSRTRRLLERSLRSGDANTSGPDRDTYVVEMNSWLSDKDLKRVNRLITELQKLLRPAPRRDGTKLCSFTLALTPVFPGEET